jgi:hypothetical protein
MTIRCPVCRAENTEATCRRCRADLGLLVALAAEREHLLAAAARALAAGQGGAAVRHAEAARQRGGGDEALRWLAAGYLSQGDYAAALACYRALRAG